MSVSYLAADAFALASLAAAFTTIDHRPTSPHNPIPERVLRYGSDTPLRNPISYPSLAISDANLRGLPEQRSQDQQIQAALPLGGTVRDTKWRVREERGPAFFVGGAKSKDTTYCTSTVIFRGIAGDSNRGTVDYDPGTCQTDVEAEENSVIFAKSKGLRWVSKTTRVIQLTARWKVKLPEGRYIYKGYIEGGRRRQIEGKRGQNNMEMTGTILTGEDDSTNRVVGKFTADLIERMND
uniref:Uncharacterized protein n=1 Tax=Minutocellus polymorphus TaxID=265543 RepID=A0A7S0ACI6_9STRA